MPKILSDGSEYGYSKEEWLTFSKSKRWRIRNPEKMKKAVRSWYDRNTSYVKTQARKYQLRDSYGITEEQYQKMLQEQQYSCAICNTKTPTGKWKVFAVDHCHKTNSVRGLLCNECNRGIGLLGDSVERLQSAINYLNKKKTLQEKKKKT